MPTLAQGYTTRVVSVKPRPRCWIFLEDMTLLFHFFFLILHIYNASFCGNFLAIPDLYLGEKY